MAAPGAGRESATSYRAGEQPGLREWPSRLPTGGSWWPHSASIVDYSERQCYGERVSNGFVESAVNPVLAKRLVKRQQLQQMQWTKKGAHQGVQRGAGGLLSAAIPRLPATTDRTNADGRLARLPHTF